MKKILRIVFVNCWHLWSNYQKKKHYRSCNPSFLVQYLWRWLLRCLLLYEILWVVTVCEVRCLDGSCGAWTSRRATCVHAAGPRPLAGPATSLRTRLLRYRKIAHMTNLERQEVMPLPGGLPRELAHVVWLVCQGAVGMLQATLGSRPAPGVMGSPAVWQVVQPLSHN